LKIFFKGPPILSQKSENYLKGVLAWLANCSRHPKTGRSRDQLVIFQTQICSDIRMVSHLDLAIQKLD
jgi:hypothetical protein